MTTLDLEIKKLLEYNKYTVLQLFNNNNTWYINDFSRVVEVAEFIEFHNLKPKHNYKQNINDNDTEMENCIRKYRKLNLTDFIINLATAKK